MLRRQEDILPIIYGHRALHLLQKAEVLGTADGDSIAVVVVVAAAAVGTSSRPYLHASKYEEAPR